MYTTKIDINRNVPNDVLNRLSVIVAKAFDNRAGHVVNVSSTPYCFIFQGGENEYGCLQLGNLALDKVPEFREYAQSWNWDDEEPDESCDLLVELSKPIY